MPDDTSPATLRRIRALLDQAESTSFPEEAEAFLAKATELMARHRVTEAMVEAARPGGARPVVVERPVELGRGPYVNARLQLLLACAASADCVLLHRNGFEGKVGIVIGHEADVARVELLYTSLSLQAASALAHCSPPRGQHGATFRRSFLFAWAGRIGERLAEARRQAEAEAQAQHDAARAAAAAAPGTGGGAPVGVALVLAERRSAVDAFVAATYPRLGTGRAPGGRRSRAGHDAGTAAAERAQLEGRPLRPGQRAIPA